MDRDKLRELAQKATPGPWNSYVYVDHDGPPACDDIGIQAPSKKRSMHVEVLCKMDWYDGGSSDFERADAESTAGYIAEIPPETILALLDALEAADVKNTLLSACLHKAEDERDRLRNLLDCRPALNSGVIEAYAKWTGVVYDSDAARKPA